MFVFQPKQFALLASVLHHGFGCFAQGSVPASKDKVIETAKSFADYLDQ